jgi:acyl transferase domain-containing protein
VSEEVSWPATIVVRRGRTTTELAAAIDRLEDDLARGALIGQLGGAARADEAAASPDEPTLAMAAGSADELRSRLTTARKYLGLDLERRHDPQGIHLVREPLAARGKVAFLFPGQGSQYVNMLRDVVASLAVARNAFDVANDLLTGELPRPLRAYVFPEAPASADEEAAQQSALTDTAIAQPAIGAASLALLAVARSLGLRPDVAAGHSYGEFVALHAAGCFDQPTLLRLSAARGRFMREVAGENAGTMAAVDAGAEALRPLLTEVDVTLANLNAPRQTVISGATSAVEQAIAVCAASGIRAKRLPVACAFHSPLVAPARDRLAAVLRDTRLRPLEFPVYSNLTAEPYPEDPAAIAALLARHLASPVEFVHEVRAMYEAGARIFVEVGPRNVLTGLVSRILEDRPHLAVPLDQPSRPGLLQLQHAIAALVSEGVSVGSAAGG